MNLSDGGSISGATTSMLTINPAATGNAGSYDVVVTDGFAQTQASTAATLTVNTTPAPVASSNSPICVGQTLQLMASTVAGASYSWSGPNAFTSSQQNPSIASATAAATGTYSVTATANGCASTPATTNVVVNTSPSSVITAPASVCPYSTGGTASVPDAGIGASYSWSITNGTITGGAGTRAITFTAGATGSVTLDVTVQNGGCTSMGSKSVPIDATCPSNFQTLSPCRVVDTRRSMGPLGGPALSADSDRPFTIAGVCGVTPGARSVALNITVTEPTAQGYFIAYPGGLPMRPVTSVLNYMAGQTRANNAVVPLGAGGTLVIYCGQTSGTTHLVIDVTGYFE